MHQVRWGYYLEKGLTTNQEGYTINIKELCPLTGDEISRNIAEIFGK
ncbi:hypothetical protein KKH39_03470 [Patescibacteria group bacterium]|nr:hypothetical protein [Patescibacteria group bacterium]